MGGVVTWGAREPGAGHPEAVQLQVTVTRLLILGQLGQGRLSLRAVGVCILAGLRGHVCLGG